MSGEQRGARDRQLPAWASHSGEDRMPVGAKGNTVVNPDFGQPFFPEKALRNPTIIFDQLRAFIPEADMDSGSGLELIFTETGLRKKCSCWCIGLGVRYGSLQRILWEYTGWVRADTELVGDRQEIPAPIASLLFVEDVYGEGSVPDWELLRRHFHGEGRLCEDLAIRLVREAAAVLRREPTLLEIEAPLTVCGDIHGQYYDLLTLLRPHIGGDVSRTKYLFLGDYVDRGYFGVECVLLLFSLKLSYPETFFLLRGNHECRHLTSFFGFKHECEIKYSIRFYEAVMDAFDCLPLAAVISVREQRNRQERLVRQFLCVHGGLSPELRSLSDFRRIDRFIEPDTHGMMCDILWSDPSGNFGEESGEEHFLHNATRGCSFFYTYKACCSFLDRNNLLGIIRGHEVQNEGFKKYASRESTSFPVLMTVFSAPNYLDSYHNKAAVMVYEDRKIKLRQFGAAKHPFWLPNFMDVFTWSFPFMAEKVTNILTILSACPDEELNQDAEEMATNPESRRRRIKGKIEAIAKVHIRLRQSRERVLAFQGLVAPNGPLPENLPDSELVTFNDVKDMDKVNERMPEILDTNAT